MRKLIRSTYDAAMRVLRFDSRARSRRAKLCRNIVTQTLECRVLLDGSFTFREVGTATELLNLAPILTKPIVNSSGDIFSAEPGVGNQEYSIRRTTPSHGSSPVKSQVVRSGLQKLEDFGANGNGHIAAIHDIPSVGEVVSVVYFEGVEQHLIIDGEEPTVLVSTPQILPGDTAALFTVEYRDRGSYIDHRLLNGREISFTGRSGKSYEVKAYDTIVDGPHVYVKYAALPSDGVWDMNDIDEFVVAIRANTVSDLAGNWMPETTLFTFNLLAWDQSTDYSVKHVPVPDPSTEIRNAERFNFIVENDVHFVRSADIKLATEGMKHSTGPNLVIVQITENGEVAFGGQFGLQSFVGYWEPALNRATLAMTPRSGSSIQALDASEEGTVVVKHDDIPRVFKFDGGSATLTSPEMNFWVESAIQISSDGSTLFYQGYAHAAIYSFGLASGKTSRIIGLPFDEVLDPGERFGAFQGTSNLDLYSMDYVSLRLLNVVNDTEGRAWVMYSETARFNAVFSTRIYAVAVRANGNTGKDALQPLLLGAQSLGSDSPNEWGHELYRLPAATLNRVSTEFHITLSIKFLKQVSEHFADPWRQAYYSTGVLPKSFSSTPSNIIERHILLEKMAREIAYWELRDPKSKYQRGTVLDNGYIIEGMYVENSGVHGIFGAVVLLPFHSNGNGAPIIAVRGSDPNDLYSTDLEEKGVGYSQFVAMDSWFQDVVKRNSRIYNEPPIVVGHSLGGALAQWFTSSLMTKTDERLSEVITFNSPGISFQAASDSAEAVKTRVINGVTHHVMIGDFVSLAGEEFIDGVVKLIYVTNAEIAYGWSLGAVPRHTTPMLYPEKQVQNDDGVQRLNIVRTVVQPDTKVLNHPEFNYLSDPEYVSFLGAANQVIGRASLHLVSRHRVEEFRKRAPASENWLDTARWLFWNVLDAQIFDSRIFVAVDLEKPITDVRRSSVSYDFDAAILSVTADMPLVAASAHWGEVLVRAAANSSEEVFQKFVVSDGYIHNANVEISNSLRKPGDYSVRFASSFVVDITTIRILETGWSGDLTGDGKIDLTDGFLVALIDAGASDETIDRLKGTSTLSAAEIRHRFTTTTVLDVNEDDKTDSTDGFLVVLVGSFASLDTIKRLKFSDAITEQKVQSNVQALLDSTVPASVSGFAAAAIRKDKLSIDQTSVGDSAVVVGSSGVDAIGIDESSVADNATILGIGSYNFAQISAYNLIGGQAAINGVQLTSPIAPLFAQYRNDLFDSLLFN